MPIFNTTEVHPDGSVGSIGDSEPPSPQPRDKGEEEGSSSVADVAATAAQQSLCASRHCSTTDGSGLVERLAHPAHPPMCGERGKCSQGTQTVEDKGENEQKCTCTGTHEHNSHSVKRPSIPSPVVQVDVVSTADCEVHVPGAVDQATQTCPESGIQTDLSYVSTHHSRSITEECLYNIHNAVDMVICP